MKTTNYPGINYAAGTGANQDTKTGIHYGVIPSNDISPDAFEDIVRNGTDLDFECAIAEFKASIGQVEDEAGLTKLLKDSFYRNANPVLWAEAIMIELSERGLPLGSVEANHAIWDEVEQTFCDQYEGTGDCTRYSYNSDGYKLQVAGDGDIFVTGSKYFTYAQFCSPCAPGACYLRKPLESPVETNRAYCLGHDWFDSDSPCPYPVYSVETGELVQPAND